MKTILRAVRTLKKQISCKFIIFKNKQVKIIIPRPTWYFQEQEHPESNISVSFRRTVSPSLDYLGGNK